MEFIREIKSTLFIMAGFYIIIGLFLLLFPEFVNNALCYLIGTLCLIMGGIGIYMYIGCDTYGSFSIYILVMAIAFITLGMFIIVKPELFISFIPIIIGSLLVINSLVKMKSAASAKKYEYDKWWVVLVSALIIFACGIILILNPFESIILLTMILGLILIIEGIGDIITAISYSKIEKSIK